MSEEVQGEAVEQSTVLNAEEVNTVLTVDEDSENNSSLELPSDIAEFEMPEKFKGKSAEDIAKAYMELEKLKSSKEEVPTESKEEETNQEDTFNKYVESYFKNGELSEAEYAELEKQGISKTEVDEHIEFINYKREKAEKAILGDIPKESYLEAAIKAKEVWGEDKVKEFNNTLNNSPITVQQMLVKSLMAEFGTTSTTEEVTLHTNQPQTQPTKGYKNRSELLKDMSDPRYETDKTFNKAVHDKLAITDDSGW